MYLSHYGLHEPPFRITPVTDFFYGGANRAAILEALIYAITRGEGIIKVVGEVGAGKTMMCRVLMERLPENVDTIYLADPSLSRDEILYAIADDLGLDLAGQRASAALRTILKVLIERFAAGRRVVLLVDEAHAIPVQTLEEVRLLSNLETRRDKLLQIVLFGQPELDDNLRLPQLRQLKDRIVHNFSMQPLEQDAVKDYIAFRMRSAGYKGPDIFSAGALRLISRASQGLTRRINILADKALLAAFVENTHGVESRHVHKAIRDSEFDVPRRRATAGYALAAAGVAALILAGIAWQWATRDPAPSTAPAAPVSAPVLPGPAESRAAEAVAAPAPATAAEPPSQASPPLPAGGASAPAGTPAARTDSVLAASEPPGTPAAESPAQGVAAPGTVSPPPDPASRAVAAVTLPAQQPAAVPEQAAVSEPQASGASPAQVEPAVHPLLRQRLAATREMMGAATGERFTIHLFYTQEASPERIESFLGRAAQAVDLSQVFLLSARVPKGTRYRVFYGNYRSRDEASAALEQLPPAYRREFRMRVSSLGEMRRST